MLCKPVTISEISLKLAEQQDRLADLFEQCSLFEKDLPAFMRETPTGFIETLISWEPEELATSLEMEVRRLNISLVTRQLQCLHAACDIIDAQTALAGDRKAESCLQDTYEEDKSTFRTLRSAIAKNMIEIVDANVPLQRADRNNYEQARQYWISLSRRAAGMITDALPENSFTPSDAGSLKRLFHRRVGYANTSAQITAIFLEHVDISRQTIAALINNKPESPRAYDDQMTFNHALLKKIESQLPEIRRFLGHTDMMLGSFEGDARPTFNAPALLIFAG